MNIAIALRGGLPTAAAVVLLTGCAAPTPAATATLTPLPSPSPSLGPPAPPKSPLPPPLPTVPTDAMGQGEVFRFVRTIQVTPDEDFTLGSFARIGYVPAVGQFAVVFTTPVTKKTAAQRFGDCTGEAQGYRMFNLDLTPAGKSGVLTCKGGDSGGIMIGNDYYNLTFGTSENAYGWRIYRYDAVTWKSVKEIFCPVEAGHDSTVDPLVSYANGQLIVGGGTSADGMPPPPEEGGQSRLNFFPLDLSSHSRRTVSDVPHRSEGSILYVDGVYSYVTSNAYVGDMIVMQYDQDWHFLSSKILRTNSHFVTGAAYESGRFYVAFMDIDLRPGGKSPVSRNIHLAAFDRDWRLLQDAAVTDFGMNDRIAARPWVIIQFNRLYVSYDVRPVMEDPDDLSQTEAFVSVYELAGYPPDGK